MGTEMVAQIKHLAIITERYTLLARFYEALFGLWTFPGRVEAAAMGVSDGHVGLNFNLRPPGRQAGLDHFGFECEDVDEAIKRAKKFDGVDFLKRPSNRPFAGMSMNDPMGNVFDLAHKEPEKLDGVYGTEAAGKPTTRWISHFMLRALKPGLLKQFYTEVFELIEQPKPSEDDPNFYLSDGKVTMIIAPWKITDYEGTGVARPAMDHLGFTVENLDAFQRDMKNLGAANTALDGMSLTATKENVSRLELLKKTSMSAIHLSDPDGVLIAVKEGRAN
jgi:predicted enzyme related to lactoylglutathione lyase